MAITNTPIEVIVKYKGFSLFPNTVKKNFKRYARAQKNQLVHCH